MTIRLCLGLPHSDSATLSLGLPCPGANSTGDFAAVLPPFACAIAVSHVIAATVAATLPVVTGYGNLDWNINLLPDTVSTAPFCWNDGRLNARAAVTCFNAGASFPQSIMPAWNAAAALVGERPVAWQQSPQLNRDQSTCWQSSLPTFNDQLVEWQQSPQLNRDQSVAWVEAEAVRQSAGSCFDNLPRVGSNAQACWRDGELVTRPLVACYRSFDGLRIGWHTCWQDAGLPEVWRRPVFSPTTDTPITRRSVRLCLGRGRNSGTRLSLGLQCLPENRSYYLIHHNFSLRRLPDGPDIEVSKINLKFDADSWAWAWNATVLGAASLAAIQPELDGKPATLEARIDDYVWRVLVEDWSDQREFGKRGIQVSGRGLTAWLADPYNVPNDGMLSVDRSMAQILDDRLPDDDSWLLVYPTTTPDWLVPSAAFSWQNKTPIQVMHEAAQSVGLMLIPDRVAQKITVLPRYPILPWQFGDELPHRVMPDAGIVSCDGGAAGAIRANAVIVHGNSVGGVMARVVREGTAGDQLAQTIECDLVTDAAAAQLLGGRILAARHEQPIINKAVFPLGGVDFPLFSVGEYVEIAGQRGIVAAVEISVSLQAVRQSVTIGESTGNMFSRWLKLLPADPLLVCRIDAVHGDGTVTVVPLAGGMMRVRGVGAVDSFVYVRGGVVESAAPPLTGSDITV